MCAPDTGPDGGIRGTWLHGEKNLSPPEIEIETRTVGQERLSRWKALEQRRTGESAPWTRGFRAR